MEALQTWLMSLLTDQLIGILVPILTAWLISKFPWAQRIIEAVVESQKANAADKQQSAIDKVADRSVLAVEQHRKEAQKKHVSVSNASAKKTAMNAIAETLKVDEQTAAVATEAAVARMNAIAAKHGNNDKRLDELESLLGKDYGAQEN